MTTINGCSSTTGSTSTPVPPLPTLPVLGRVGWLCARCSRSYAPDVRECLACAPPAWLGYTVYTYPWQPQSVPTVWISSGPLGGSASARANGEQPNV
jgi:hypothetical protein